MASSQKDVVRNFLTMVTNGDIRPAYDTYVHPDFIHHNVYFKGDRESLLVAMEENQKQMPSKKFEIKKIVEEGDTVITFSHLQMNGMQMSVVHVHRLKDGKIIEMWDVGQQIPADSPNENGPF